MSSSPDRASLELDGPSLERLRATFGDEDGLNDLLAEFLAASPTLLDQMAAGLKLQRTEEVKQAAHTLKSMAWLIGATTLADACRTVESHARAAAPPVQPAEVARVGRLTRLAQRAVQRLLR